MHSDLVIARKEYKKMILDSKSQHWQEFTTDADSPSKISKLVRSLNKTESNFLGLLKDPTTGEFIDNPQASAKVLLNKFFPNHGIPDPEKDSQLANCLWDCDIDRGIFIILL